MYIIVKLKHVRHNACVNLESICSSTYMFFVFRLEDLHEKILIETTGWLCCHAFLRQHNFSD